MKGSLTSPKYLLHILYIFQSDLWGRGKKLIFCKAPEYLWDNLTGRPAPFSKVLERWINKKKKCLKSVVDRDFPIWNFEWYEDDSRDCIRWRGTSFQTGKLNHFTFTPHHTSRSQSKITGNPLTTKTLDSAPVKKQLFSFQSLAKNQLFLHRIGSQRH